MKLFSGKVLIKPEIEEQTSSGFYLTNESQDFTYTGEVLEVADDVDTVKKGDRVIYNVYAAQDVSEKPLKQVVKLEEVMAIIHA